jgi:hypothetical protein
VENKMNDLFVPDNTTPAVLEARAKIMNIQNSCMSLGDEHRMDESPPFTNWLVPGVYCREIHLPADSVVVGRIHKFEHMSIISKGSVTVFTEFGEYHYKAGDSFVSPAGTKRVVLSHEDTTWTTIHPNPDNEQDIETLENRYTAKEYEELGMVVGELLEDLT